LREQVQTDLLTVDELAKRCVMLADRECKGYSPIYERLSRQLALDHGLLARLAEAPQADRLPVSLFAAVNLLVRQADNSHLAAIYRGGPGDPWPPFRDLVEARFDDVVAVLETHTIQTNEVGRAAALVPSIGRVISQFPDRPLALVEVGPSAGLNLLFDHYSVLYDDGRRFGTPADPVQLTCALVGPTPPPLPERSDLAIEGREGIDLAPIDVRDAEACEWLEACIWPDVPGRLERLQAALAHARSDPPTLHTGNALDLLSQVVEAVPARCLPMVFTTWAMAYLDDPGRRQVHELLAEIGQRRDLALLTAEWPHVTPWVPTAPRAPSLHGHGATLVALTWWRDGEQHIDPIAWMHSHGQWLEWFGESEHTP
jgi:hypothetical protein